MQAVDLITLQHDLVMYLHSWYAGEPCMNHILLQVKHECYENQ